MHAGCKPMSCCCCIDCKLGGDCSPAQVELLSWKSTKDITDDGGVTKATLEEGRDWKKPSGRDEVLGGCPYTEALHCVRLAVLPCAQSRAVLCMQLDHSHLFCMCLTPSYQAAGCLRGSNMTLHAQHLQARLALAQMLQSMCLLGGVAPEGCFVCSAL